MNINTANGLLFVLAGLTPFIVYLGLGPDGTAVLDQARAEQLFAYLFFFSSNSYYGVKKNRKKLFYR